MTRKKKTPPEGGEDEGKVPTLRVGVVVAEMLRTIKDAEHTKSIAEITDPILVVQLKGRYERALEILKKRRDEISRNLHGKP